MGYIPPGYHWVTVKGKPVLLPDLSFSYRQDINTGNFIDHRNDEISEFVSDTELIEHRREKEIEQNQKEAERLNTEEKLKDKQKQEVKKVKKLPRKQVISENHQIGRSLVHNGNTYRIVARISLEDKFSGYYVYDEKDVLWFLTKYGDLRQDVPKRYRDL